MKYKDIAFAYEWEDESIDNLLSRLGENDGKAITDAIDYLRQWENTDNELLDNVPYGTSDYTEQIGPYILSYNLGLGYIALCKIVKGVKNGI